MRNERRRRQELLSFQSFKGFCGLVALPESTMEIVINDYRTSQVHFREKEGYD
jgi:hypothetical protein